MDPIQPVGAMIQPPNPNQGLNAYSTLLGIQSQKLGIQQQQQGLQGQAALVSQEQQKNQELQQAHQIAVQGAANGEDRMTTARKISAVGPYAQSMASSLLSQANEVVQNRQAIQKLTMDQKSEIGNTIQSLVQDPELSQSKFIDEIERLRSQHPNDPDFSRLLTSTTALAINKDDTQPQLRGKLSQMWSALSGQQQAKPYTQGVGPGAVSGAENVMTGARTPASFQPFALGPTDQPGYKAQVAGVTAQAGGLGAGTSKIDVDTYNKALTAGAQSSTIMDLAKRVEREAGEARTGKFSQEFANRLTAFQQHNPGATAIQVLQKDAANLKTMAEAGLSTDAERAQVGAGLPSPETMGPDALQKAARYWQGYAKMTGGRRDVALSNQGPAGYAVKDAEYMKGASPGAYEPKQTATSAQLADYARRKGISLERAREHAESHGMTISQ